MTEMILVGDSYEKSCWKWSGRHSGTTDWVWDITIVILGVILGVILEVVLVILMTEMILMRKDAGNDLVNMVGPYQHLTTFTL